MIQAKSPSIYTVYMQLNFILCLSKLFAFFRNMEWCVCYFQIDDSVEVVPNNWIISENQCVWPLIIKPSKLFELIKKKEIPNDDWKTISVILIFKYILFNI